MTTIESVQSRVGEVMEANGWREGTEKLSAAEQVRQDITELALITTEVSEAVEELRNGHDSTERYYSAGKKPEGVPSELADIVIRVMDFADRRGIDLQDAILEKLEYNTARGHRHGGKKV